MKLGPVTKLDNRNKTTSKKIDNDVMSRNCDIIVIFLIYGIFRANRKPNSGCIVCKTYVSINSNFWSYKNWKQNLKISNTALTILLWLKQGIMQMKSACGSQTLPLVIFEKKVSFLPKIVFFKGIFRWNYAKSALF